MRYPEPESSRLEFKREIPKNDQIIKTVVAFCNHHGGKIIIGVNDDGRITGIPEKTADQLQEQIEATIYDACSPPIFIETYLQRIEKKLLLIIEVSPGRRKPYYITSFGQANGVYVRLGRSTLKADPDTIEELRLMARGLTYDQTPVYRATENDISEVLVSNFLKLRKGKSRSRVTTDLLFSYEVLVEDQKQSFPTVAGTLLFCQNPQRFLTEAYVICSHFSGVKGREPIASVNCTGTLFEQYDTAFNFILERINRSFKIQGKKRAETFEIPEEAIREVLMNSLLHRNYHIRAPIKIAIYKDRIEFFSPGIFPGPINVNNLESGITYVRNPAIAKILMESHYVEKRGTGFLTLFESYRQAKLKKPTVIEGENFIKCILPRIAHPTSKTLNDVTDNPEQTILNLAETREQISISDVVKELYLSRATAGRLLATLVKEKKLIRKGQGRSTHYRLKR